MPPGPNAGGRRAEDEGLMESLAEIFLVLLSLALVLYVLIDYLRGRTELVSIRNVAIAPLIDSPSS